MIRKVADNRREQEQVVQNFIQPCPARLCEGAAYIESIITWVGVFIYRFMSIFPSCSFIGASIALLL